MSIKMLLSPLMSRDEEGYFIPDKSNMITTIGKYTYAWTGSQILVSAGLDPMATGTIVARVFDNSGTYLSLYGKAIYGKTLLGSGLPSSITLQDVSITEEWDDSSIETLALTWTPTEITMYINGTFFATAPHASPANPSFILEGGYSLEQSLVFDHVLTADELLVYHTQQRVWLWPSDEAYIVHIIDERQRLLRREVQRHVGDFTHILLNHGEPDRDAGLAEFVVTSGDVVLGGGMTKINLDGASEWNAAVYGFSEYGAKVLGPQETGSYVYDPMILGQGGLGQAILGPSEPSSVLIEWYYDRDKLLDIINYFPNAALEVRG